jgi:DNA-binding NtrC family response regulator
MEYIPNNPTPVLIVDDDTGFLLTIKAILVKAGMAEPALVSDSRRVPELLAKYPFQFVLIDMVMPEIDGLTLLKQIKSSHADVECVIVTVLDDISSAVQAIRYGAYDYLLKPVSPEKLFIVIKRALERYCMRHELAVYEKEPPKSDLKHPEAFDDIIAADKAMVRVFHQVEIVSPTDYSVVITGESGTGKELVARTIHRLSPRAEKPFVPVNMGAVSVTLFKDDFFGHSSGAYTGASHERKGFLEAAKDGTLFMDEITDLDIIQQGALLRVLQEKEFYRLGSTQSRTTNIRIIAATNRSFAEEIKQNRFRADLLHRLNMFNIHLPPLRERPADILPLARHFLQVYAEQNGKTIQDLSPDLAGKIAAYSFPGNVRELMNIIASAVLREKSDTLTTNSLANHLNSSSSTETDLPHDLKTLLQVEQEYIRKVISETHGNRTHAAKILGIGRRTLQRKLNQIATD